jgi:hypothetical protein
VIHGEALLCTTCSTSASLMIRSCVSTVCVHSRFGVPDRPCREISVTSVWERFLPPLCVSPLASGAAPEVRIMAPCGLPCIHRLHGWCSMHAACDLRCMVLECDPAARLR